MSIDPLFKYIADNRETISRSLYGQPSERKRYKRANQHLLPGSKPIDMSLSEALTVRKSIRNYSKSGISLDLLGALLYWSTGVRTDIKTNNKHFPYPSGGSKYPLEIYVLINRVNGIGQGVYHYVQEEHILEETFNDVPTNEQIQTCFKHSFEVDIDTHAIISLSFVKSRSIQKYGSLSYSLALLEAGHVGQNIYLAAAALGLGCCALGNTNYESIHNILGIDGMNEQSIYNLAVGLSE